MNVFKFSQKLINFIKKKFFSFPTLNFLISSKSSLLKNLYVNFWIFVSKKNKSFKNIFLIIKNFKRKMLFAN